MSGTLQAYRLCRFCTERQGTGGAGFVVVPGIECSVCSGLMERSEKLGSLAVRELRAYDFRTFAVGVSLPEGVQEREDELRSALRLKGSETIKTQAARLVASVVSRSTRKRQDKRDPDATVLVNFGAGDVSVASKPLFYYARYAKPAGIAQRRSFCEICRGEGCEKCRGTGYERRPSVEESLRKKISGFCGSNRMVFTWLGSEDKESRVCPPGRPFVAEVKSPMKRRLPRKFAAKLRKGTLQVTAGKVLPSKPTRLPPFRFLTQIRAVSTTRVDPKSLRTLGQTFKDATVTFQRPNNRPAMKKVYGVTADVKGRTLFIKAELDGGLPVKRFVNGDLVSPSVSEVLKTEVGCRSFDICKVKEIGEFQFAEITRGEEKN